MIKPILNQLIAFGTLAVESVVALFGWQKNMATVQQGSPSAECKLTMQPNRLRKKAWRI